MHVATATLESLPGSPYSSSRFHDTEFLEKESHDAHEGRTWREKCHADKEGVLYIPPMAFKNALADAAKMLSLRIPGKGTKTYTKHFLSGVQVREPLSLGVKKSEVKGEWVFCNADGVRGSGKRVKRCFPVVPEWSGKLNFLVVDDTITEDVFTRVLKEAGMLIGVGRFRAGQGGYNGLFLVKSIKWAPYRMAA
jgi:hypothetical protein